MDDKSYFENMIEYAQMPSFDFFDDKFRTVALLNQTKNSSREHKTFKYGNYDMLDMMQAWQFNPA